MFVRTEIVSRGNGHPVAGVVPTSVSGRAREAKGRNGTQPNRAEFRCAATGLELEPEHDQKPDRDGHPKPEASRARAADQNQQRSHARPPNAVAP